jgi:hypothetical protein
MQFPPAVAEYVDQARRDCPAGFQAGQAVETADLTGSGQPGYIVDPHKMSCAGSPHLFGGSGPASIELFALNGAGQVAHKTGVLALAYKIVPAEAGGAPVIAFTTHNTTDAAGSIDSYRWNGTDFGLISHRSMAGPPED